MPRSLRVRSIVAAASAVLLALVVVGVLVDVLVAQHLKHSFDHTLRTRAAEVAQLSAAAPALLTSAGALDARSVGSSSSCKSWIVMGARWRVRSHSTDASCR